MLRHDACFLINPVLALCLKACVLFGVPVCLGR
jgi:hypothetical protein